MRTLKSRTSLALAFTTATALAIGLALTLAQGSKSSARAPEAFAALSALPEPAAVPPKVLDFIDRAATVMGINASALRGRARLLRSGLGVRSRSVWAFADDRGRPCYVVTDSAGGCATLDTINPPGLHWSIGAGYPDEPSPFIALAADAIDAVSLTVDGADIEVSLKNNVAYATYPNDAKVAVISAHYRDGSTRSQTVSLTG